MENAVLDIQNLEIQFETGRGMLAAVKGVSLHVGAGETVGLVGESGCGKSVTAFASIRLLPNEGCAFSADVLRYKDVDVLRCSTAELRHVRGTGIGFIFQDALAALDPVFTIGDQLIETVLAHQELSRQEAFDLSVKALAEVEIPDPLERMRAYPHQLSGGMRQRVMMAMALINGPGLLIADEPTTSLDVTVQAQLLTLLRKKIAASGMSMLFITHDLGVVREIAQRIIVMYAGRIVEEGPVEDVLASPAHPYTKGLLAAVPDINSKKDVFETIPGRVPGLVELAGLGGCVFQPRCAFAMPKCSGSEPALCLTGDQDRHYAACYLLDQERGNA